MFILSFLAVGQKGWGQVVNIEARRMRTDSVRLAGFAQASLALTNNDDLVFTTDFQFFYDEAPPPGIRKRASSFRQGIKFQF